MSEDTDSQKSLPELDFVVKDPPLKRLKQHLTAISTAYEPRAAPAPELSPNSLKSQLKQDESLLIGVLKESASHLSVILDFTSPFSHVFCSMKQFWKSGEAQLRMLLKLKPEQPISVTFPTTFLN